MRKKRSKKIGKSLNDGADEGHHWFRGALDLKQIRIYLKILKLFQKI